MRAVNGGILLVFCLLHVGAPPPGVAAAAAEEGVLAAKDLI
jgi:hypothetical protein